MPVLGITGGVGSGKSTFTRLLLGQLPAEAFDADECVGRLLKSDGAVQSKLRDAFGNEAFDSAGNVDRDWLRSHVFADAVQRKVLEDILHPQVRQEWSERAEMFRSQNRPDWLFVEIPLLFETQAERWFDYVVAIGCSREVQLTRLVQHRRLPHEIAEKMIDAQLPIAEKATRADFVIWNDGTTAALGQQVALLATTLRRRHG